MSAAVNEGPVGSEVGAEEDGGRLVEASEATVVEVEEEDEVEGEEEEEDEEVLRSEALVRHLIIDDGPP